MITLIVAGYILFSVILTLVTKLTSDWKDYPSWGESAIRGFLFIPKLACIIGVILGVVWCLTQLATAVAHIIEWTYHNMP